MKQVLIDLIYPIRVLMSIGFYFRVNFFLYFAIRRWWRHSGAIFLSKTSRIEKNATRNPAPMKQNTPKAKMPIRKMPPIICLAKMRTKTKIRTIRMISFIFISYEASFDRFNLSDSSVDVKWFVIHYFLFLI